MNKLKEISRKLSDIKKISHEIALCSINILKILDEDDNKLVSDFCDAYEDVDQDVAAQYLEKKINDFTEDAENILKEYDKFNDILLKGTDTIYKYEEECPFFVSVWCGDTYDVDGIEGLKKLYDELRRTLKIISTSSDFIRYSKETYDENE